MSQMPGHIPVVICGIHARTWTYPLEIAKRPCVVTTPDVQVYPDLFEPLVALTDNPLFTDSAEGSKYSAS
jgi:hypothetical protein